MYNDNMNTTYRQTLKDPTNLSIPYGIYNILLKDAAYFNFFKNGEPNISGFLNFLIPKLDEFKEYIHENLLEDYSGDIEKTRDTEKKIFKHHIAPFDFRHDGQVSVPFRVNKALEEKFLTIYDTRLSYYETSFTMYIRRLLTEYATRAIDQREYIVHFNKMSIIEDAIQKNVNCIFRCANETIEFVPISIEISDNNRRILISGITLDREEVFVLRLSLIQSVSQQTQTIEVTDADYSAVLNTLHQFYKQEQEEGDVCLA